MAEEPEVIQEQMEETRSALADKLGQLGQKITGTVDSVSEAVEDTVEAVAETVENVGETAEEAVEAVKETFNIPKQFNRHPWLFVGGSVILGFVVGKMLPSGQQRPRERHELPTTQKAEDMTRLMSQSDDYPTETSRGGDRFKRQGRRQTGNGYDKAPKESQEQSFLGGLVQQFMPDLTKLKALALGTVFATARDLLTKNMPQNLKKEVVHVMDDMAVHAGGKPIQGKVLEEGPHQSQNPKNESNSGQKEVTI
jgi:ElaB/YqjD/DUF883 family membrane-anchored ribosome-binding protein